MTVEDNLAYSAFSKSRRAKSKQKLEQVYVSFPQRKEQRTKFAGDTHSGTKNHLVVILPNGRTKYYYPG